MSWRMAVLLWLGCGAIVIVSCAIKEKWDDFTLRDLAASLLILLSGLVGLIIYAIDKDGWGNVVLWKRKETK